MPRIIKSPESCGTIIRHTLPKAVPASATSAPRLPKSRRQVAPGAEVRPNTDQNWPNIANIWPTWSKLGQHLPQFRQFWSHTTIVGTNLVKFAKSNGKTRPKLASLCQTRPKLPALGRVLVKLGHFGPMFGDVRPTLIDSGPKFAPLRKFRRVLGNFGACAAVPGTAEGVASSFSATFGWLQSPCHWRRLSKSAVVTRQACKPATRNNHPRAAPTGSQAAALALSRPRALKRRIETPPTERKLRASAATGWQENLLEPPARAPQRTHAARQGATA